jgi:ligand-binding SRPBCC domain-containing protein
MKPYTFECAQILPIGIDQAWEFFADPRNLPLITPPSMDFKFLSAPDTEAYAGMIFCYTLRPLFGITVNWTTEITHLNKPILFVDEQRFGPYRFWHHQHIFKEIENGVEMRDLVHYLLPHIQFTGLVNRFIVAPRLRRIFDFRRKALQEIFTTQAVVSKSGTVDFELQSR